MTKSDVEAVRIRLEPVTVVAKGTDLAPPEALLGHFLWLAHAGGITRSATDVENPSAVAVASLVEALQGEDLRRAVAVLLVRAYQETHPLPHLRLLSRKKKETS